MLIFYDTELRLVGTRHSHGTDVSPSCLGLRRGTRAEHWVKQLICQNNLKKNESNDIELSHGLLIMNFDKLRYNEERP